MAVEKFGWRRNNLLLSSMTAEEIFTQSTVFLLMAIKKLLWSLLMAEKSEPSEFIFTVQIGNKNGNFQKLSKLWDVSGSGFN